MITVVDAPNLFPNFESDDFLLNRGETDDDYEERLVVELLVDQIEFADTIIQNKLSATSAENLKNARAIICSLNADEVLYETDYSRVELKNVFGTRRFDLEKAEKHPTWYKELHGFKDHVPEALKYGIRSFLHMSQRPFDPMKFAYFMPEPWPGVVRAKRLILAFNKDGLH